MKWLALAVLLLCGCASDNGIKRERIQDGPAPASDGPSFGSKLIQGAGILLQGMGQGIQRANGNGPVHCESRQDGNTVYTDCY